VWVCDQEEYIDKKGKYVWSSSAMASGSVMPAGYNQTSAQPCPVSNTGGGDQLLSERYVESLHRPVVIQDQPMAPSENAVAPEYEPQRYDRGEEPRRRRGRSKGRSAAIVVGSAAAGAGIGALAGGGKGAAIGAASGGTAGFVYDRMTHNHR
jgi:hypothetical protein